MTDTGPDSLAAARAAAEATGSAAAEMAAAYSAAASALQDRVDAMQRTAADRTNPTAADLDAYIEAAALAAETAAATAVMLDDHIAAVLSVRVRAHGTPPHLVAHADQVAAAHADALDELTRRRTADPDQARAAQADAAADLDDPIERWRAADDT